MDDSLRQYGERLKIEAEVRTGKRVSGRSAFPNVPYTTGQTTCARCGNTTDAWRTVRTGSGDICDPCALTADTPPPPTFALWFGAIGAASLAVAGLFLAISGARWIHNPSGELASTIGYVALILGAGAGVTATAIGMPLWRQRDNGEDITGQSKKSTAAMSAIALAGAVMGGLALVSAAVGTILSMIL